MEEMEAMGPILSNVVLHNMMTGKVLLPNVQFVYQQQVEWQAVEQQQQVKPPQPIIILHQGQALQWQDMEQPVIHQQQHQQPWHWL